MGKGRKGKGLIIERNEKIVGEDIRIVEGNKIGKKEEGEEGNGKEESKVEWIDEKVVIESEEDDRSGIRCNGEKERKEGWRIEIEEGEEICKRKVECGEERGGKVIGKEWKLRNEEEEDEVEEEGDGDIVDLIKKGWKRWEDLIEDRWGDGIKIKRIDRGVEEKRIDEWRSIDEKRKEIELGGEDEIRGIKEGNIEERNEKRIDVEEEEEIKEKKLGNIRKGIGEFEKVKGIVVRKEKEEEEIVIRMGKRRIKVKE